MSQENTNPSNNILERLRRLVYDKTPATADEWYPLMELAGQEPVALDYLRGYGCNYKDLSTCRGAVTRARRNKFRKDPLEHLNPDTLLEYQKIGFHVVWGITPNLEGPGFAHCIYLVQEHTARLAWVRDEFISDAHIRGTLYSSWFFKKGVPLSYGIRDGMYLADEGAYSEHYYYDI